MRCSTKPSTITPHTSLRSLSSLDYWCPLFPLFRFLFRCYYLQLYLVLLLRNSCCVDATTSPTATKYAGVSSLTLAARQRPVLVSLRKCQSIVKVPNPDDAVVTIEPLRKPSSPTIAVPTVNVPQTGHSANNQFLSSEQRQQQKRRCNTTSKTRIVATAASLRFFAHDHENNNSNKQKNNRHNDDRSDDIDQKQQRKRQQTGNQPSFRNNFLDRHSCRFHHRHFTRILRAGSVENNTLNHKLTSLEATLKLLLETVTTVGSIVFPPLFIIITNVVRFYNQLPHDALLAQAGLVYCFAGGYFPTLFASISIAQQSGINTVIQSCHDIVQEGSKAIQAVINDDFDIKSVTSRTSGSTNMNDVDADLSSYSFGERSNQGLWSKTNDYKNYNSKYSDLNARERFGRKTRIVLATIDPMKINTAISALYTTWLGISSVLERQFIKTITLSLTLADNLLPIVSTVLIPPLQMIIPIEFYKWIPLLLEWICKSISMSIAWKMQRILTASTSAIAGGLLFSRSILRLLARQRQRFFTATQSLFQPTTKNNKHKPPSNNKNRSFRSRKQMTDTSDTETAGKFQSTIDDDSYSFTGTATSSRNDGNDTFPKSTEDNIFNGLDEVIGLTVAAMGLYAQLGGGRGFLSFSTIPFPLNIIAWPFTAIENWIQWQITKKKAK